MPIEPIAPLLFIQQMGPAGKIIKDEATHPETSQTTFRQVVAEALSQQGSQVKGVDGISLLISLDEEPHSNNKNSDKMLKEYKEKEAAKEEVKGEDSEIFQDEVDHLGNFVNRKV